MESKKDDSDTWIEVNFTQVGPSMHASLEGRALERLLKDAQDGSSVTSVTGSGLGSPQCEGPTGERSPTELKRGAEDWLWDWSSRPDVNNGNGQNQGPPKPLPSLWSLRNKSIMTHWSIDNLPAILFSHACTFLIGAATMFWLLRKYSGHVAGTVVVTD